jgi:hypothetical protein
MGREPRATWRKVLQLTPIVLLLPIILRLALLGLALHGVNKIVVYLLVWVWWLPSGKDVLYVSSDSPIWKEYMEAEIFPLVAKRAVVLSWSDRSKMAKVVFCCSRFPHVWSWTRFQSYGRTVSAFPACNDFSLLTSVQRMEAGNSTSVEQLRRDLMQAL